MVGGATTAEQREKTDTKKKSAEPVWNKDMSLYVYALTHAIVHARSRDMHAHTRIQAEPIMS